MPKVRPEVVYRWEGPPSIALTRRRVTPPSGGAFELHELTVQNGRPGAVIVATSGNSILFVNHFRPALNMVITELPRGFADLSDSGGLATGVREFKEELGLTLKSAQHLGEYVLDTAIYPTRVSVVGGDIDPEEQPTKTDGEIQSWTLIEVADVQRQILRGDLRDGHTLSALSIYFASRSN